MAERKLRDLKIGDYVILENYHGLCYLLKIRNITPKGFIDVCGKLFNPETGRERTSDAYRIDTIRVAEPEEVLNYKYKKKRQVLLFGIDEELKFLSNEQLEKVFDFIRGLNDVGKR